MLSAYLLNTQQCKNLSEKLGESRIVDLYAEVQVSPLEVALNLHQLKEGHRGIHKMFLREKYDALLSV